MEFLIVDNEDNGWKQINSKNDSDCIKKIKGGIKEYSIDYIKTINPVQGYYDVFIPSLNELLVEMGIPVIKDYVAKTETWTRNNNTNTNSKYKRNDIIITPTKKQPKSTSRIGLDAMKLSLNKLTDKNYIDISLKMEDMVEEWLKIETSQEEIEKMGEIIFNIASNNRMFSKVYADLYSYLSSKNKKMSYTFYTNFIKYRALFETIDVNNNSDDYDSFCKINVTNEKRRAVSTFMVNLVKNNMLESGELYNIILSLLERLKVNIQSEDNILVNQELIDNIIILYDNASIYTEFSSNDNVIIEYIRYIAITPKNELVGINSKTKFKCMDYIKI